ncbi:MAG: DUF1294 domain-containing protein [Lachnospiraceae bacterium]|nr:DUF1294 domain-containing protein [Lachnospiraceae bacterium]
MKIGMAYLVLANLVGFVLMGIDKHKARKKQWRIPEKTLFLSAILGGSIGALYGMHLFRHKTKHKSFVFGMPAILVVQLLLIIIICL